MAGALFPVPPNKKLRKSLIRSPIHWPRRSRGPGGWCSGLYRCIVSTWWSCCCAWAGSAVPTGAANASRSRFRRLAASLKSGGRSWRSEMISGWLWPVPASSTARAFCAAATSPGCALVTMVMVSWTACRYVDASAIAVTGHARPAATSNGANALRAVRVFRSLSRRLSCSHALGELEQIEGLAPDAEVEVDEHDCDLDQRSYECVNNLRRPLRYGERHVTGHQDPDQIVGKG